MNMKTRTDKKTKFELFHSTGDFFWTALRFGSKITEEGIHQAFLEKNYESVKTFIRPTDNLEEQLEAIFRDSQNGDEPWNRAKNCRSTSVGDVIRVGKDYWIVASRGFVLGWQSNNLC